MSSLHQDRLLVEGSEPGNGTASTLPSARGTSRRTVGTSEKQATRTVPTQRPGTARQSATTKTSKTSKASKATPAARTKTGAGASGSLARAKAATVKTASAKAATAKAATAKAATAARAAAVTTVANGTASVRVARATRATVKPAATKTAKAAGPKGATKAATTAKPTAEKAAPAKATTAKATTAKAATAKAATAKAATAKAATAEAATAEAPRPTPHKRQAAVAPSLVPVVDAAELLRAESPEVVVVREFVAPDSSASDTATTARLPRFLRRRPPLVRRRPALYLAAALVGALGVTTITTSGPEARATTTMSSSVSVAEQLGIEAADPTEALTVPDATERLGELAASRNTRDAEQAAAAQAQAEADRVAAEAAAEAARPKAVLPVQGARLTSTFGPRWGSMHSGIDLAAPMLTPEYAVMDGVVLEAGPASGYGNAVYIQHENGDVTVYGHMEEIHVQAGQVVKAGDTIAFLGNRGQSTGPHLHFEVHAGGMNGTKIDPLPWLRERGLDI